MRELVNYLLGVASGIVYAVVTTATGPRSMKSWLVVLISTAVFVNVNYLWCVLSDRRRSQ